MRSFSPLGLATAAAFATLALAAPAVAGEQYVDETGFAASGYDVVEYFELDQAPVGNAQPKAVPGMADITADWNGATWAFATEENRDAFLADPQKYAPQFDGHCAYGVAKGGKVLLEGPQSYFLSNAAEKIWDSGTSANINPNPDPEPQTQTQP